MSSRIGPKGRRSKGIASDEVDAYLASCFERQSSPRVSELAHEEGASRCHLSRTFLLSAGLTLSAYLKNRQIERAKCLLAESDLSENEIAYMTGHGTRRTFFRSFRKATGVTPGMYRAAARPRAQNVSSPTIQSGGGVRSKIRQRLRSRKADE